MQKRINYLSLLIIFLLIRTVDAYSLSRDLTAKLLKFHIECQDSLRASDKERLNKLMAKTSLEEQVDNLFFLADSLRNLQPELSKKILQTAYLKSKDLQSEDAKIKVWDDLAKLLYSTNDKIKSKELAFAIIASAPKAKNENSKGRIANAYNLLGMLFEDYGNREEALSYYFQALNKLEEINDFKGQSAILNNIGILYTSLADYNRALKSLIKALKIKKENQFFYKIPPTLQAIGNVFFYLNKYKDALDYYHQALNSCRGIDRKDMYAEIYSGLGMVYLKTEDYLKAYENYLKAYQYDQESGSTYYQALSANSVGTAALLSGMKKDAQKYFKEALKLASSIKDTSTIVQANINLIKYGLTEGKSNKLYPMVEYAEQHLNFLTEVEKIEGMFTLAEYYLIRQDYLRGHDYHLKAFELKDKIFNDKLAKESSRLLKELEKVQSFDLKANKIKDNAFSKMQNDFIRNKKTFYILISIIIFSGLVITGLIYKIRKLKKQI